MRFHKSSMLFNVLEKKSHSLLDDPRTEIGTLV